eukprot:TRINITY_DN74981_c0_g1_i1.p1 TRINITY_DN74981_c0_g1~~TRINITY_DN74981_c0_g1_i1.p1  ORF type:complete len:354 (+),score=35.03 TRINITY_DN74981_c0_g1_i1:78-1064(+)
MGEEVEDWTEDTADLPAPLTGSSVYSFLEPFGYMANNEQQWQSTPAPELLIKVTGHSTSGKHTLYTLECSLRHHPQRRRADQQLALDPKAIIGTAASDSSSSRSTADSSTDPDEASNLSWSVARRLVHLRAGLHDPVKRQLGSSYEPYFCKVPFAHRLRPAGTTARLDAWCSRLAYCISSKLVPPVIAANTLRLLGAPQPRLAHKPDYGAVETTTGPLFAGQGGLDAIDFMAQVSALPDFSALIAASAPSPRSTSSRETLPPSPGGAGSSAATSPSLGGACCQAAASPSPGGAPSRAYGPPPPLPPLPKVLSHPIDIELPGLEDESDR